MVDDTTQENGQTDDQSDKALVEPKPNESAAELKALQDQVEALRLQLQMAESSTVEETPKEEPGLFDGLSEDELEAMPRKRFAQEQQEKLLAAVEKQFGNQAQQLQEQIAALQAQIAVDRCAAKHPDFWDYQDAMYKIALENPTILPETAYSLAKLQQSEMAAEEKARREAAAKLAKSERPSGTGSDTHRKVPLTVEEQSDAAWNEVMGEGSDHIKS